MDYGKNFRRAREVRGLDQKDAAAALGISASFLSNIERNKKRPNLDLVIKAAEVYGVDRAFLIKEQDEININSIFTEKNKSFVEDSNLLSLEEIIDKYNIKLDGKKLTNQEIKALIAFVRSMRSLD